MTKWTSPKLKPFVQGRRRWWRNKMGRSPASPQIHQKLIKIRNSSYKATSRQQQKTPGLQGDRLSSLKWGGREDGDMKRENMENFWRGACALREGGSPETGVNMNKEAPLQAGPRGSCGILENRTKQGLRGQKTEKPPLLSPLIAHRLWPQPDGRLGNREWGGI